MEARDADLDVVPYRMYRQAMAKPRELGVEEARRQLPTLLADAEKGATTIITRHGRGIAAIVPLDGVRQARPRSLLALAGTGKGLWGKDSSGAVRRMRDEWSR